MYIHMCMRPPVGDARLLDLQLQGEERLLLHFGAALRRGMKHSSIYLSLSIHICMCMYIYIYIYVDTCIYPGIHIWCGVNQHISVREKSNFCFTSELPWQAVWYSVT